MKTVFALFVVVAMLAVAFAQVAPLYNYGYNTYTPGARVSHYASSGVAAPAYAYNYGYGAHPYRWC